MAKEHIQKLGKPVQINLTGKVLGKDVLRIAKTEKPEEKENAYRLKLTSWFFRTTKYSNRKRKLTIWCCSCTHSILAVSGRRQEICLFGMVSNYGSCLASPLVFTGSSSDDNSNDAEESSYSVQGPFNHSHNHGAQAPCLQLSQHLRHRMEHVPRCEGSVCNT